MSPRPLRRLFSSHQLGIYLTMKPVKTALPNGEDHPTLNGIGKESDEKKTHKKRKRDEDSKSSKKKRRTENAISQSTQSLTTSSQPLLYLETYAMWLSVSPVSQSRALEGTCAEYLSPLLLTYYQPFRGIVLSYENARLSEKLEDSKSASTITLAKSFDEYAGSFVWLTADFVIFRPRKGMSIDGWVNLQAHSHLNLICWNLFSASIPRKRLPKDWTWVADGQSTSSGDGGRNRHLYTSTGHYLDASGQVVQGRIKFKIMTMDAARSSGKGRGFVSIQGTLLDN